jgi:broad specificity phosphatase PhoE
VACYFITHAEVDIEPDAPIEAWGLSAAGRARAQRAGAVMRGNVRTLVSSTEQKAFDTARILSDALHIRSEVDPALGEMDRTSTGYLRSHRGSASGKHADPGVTATSQRRTNQSWLT